MMKILVLTDRYPPYYVGAYELMCYAVVEYLRSHDYDITILTTTFGIDHKSSKGNIQRVLTLVNPLAGKHIARRAKQLTSLMHGLQNYCLTRHIAKKTKPDLAFIWHMGSTTILPIFAVQDLGIETLYALGSHWLFHVEKE